MFYQNDALQRRFILNDGDSPTLQQLPVLSINSPVVDAGMQQLNLTALRGILMHTCALFRGAISWTLEELV